MKQLLITTTENTDKLKSMIFLDKGKYDFYFQKEGLLLKFKEANIQSFYVFCDRLSNWLSRELFIRSGNLYFEQRPDKEKWDLWKQDRRFVEAYCDEMYQKQVSKIIYGILGGVWDEDGLEDVDMVIGLDVLFDVCGYLTEIRHELIASHFHVGAHGDYILQKLAQFQPELISCYEL